MNSIKDIKSTKFRLNSNLTQSKAKSNMSTISVSNSTKYSSKIHLAEILDIMDSEYPLSDLAEYIEKETGGKFTQLTLREILDKLYPDLVISDKMFLIKHIPLSKVGITPYSPLISLLYLFKFFQSITKEKIYSPSLIFYYLAHKMQFSHSMTTIDYFHSIGLGPEMKITTEEFYLNYGKRLGLDDVESIILFKGIDYNNDRKILTKDLILVIDSYRSDNLNDKYISGDTSKRNDVNLLKIFLEKNFITLDLIFENSEYNYMDYSDIRSFLINELYIYRRFIGEEDRKINETIIENVLSSIKRNEKIFQKDLKNYLGEFIFNQEKITNNINNPIELTQKQKYWINKFIDMINTINSSPKIIFNFSIKNSNKNVVKIIELMKQVIRIFPKDKIKPEEMEEIINSLDINKTGLIEINQYNIIMNSINDIKDAIRTKIENGMDEIRGGKEKIINMWSQGIKSKYYYLLPAKGNYDVLEKITQIIKNNIIFDDK